ncbi:hypothetical protein AYY17_01870 [Morganella psychrotolerans]|uniref:Uncharacterized protein n=1 Tax=Morganella psychrotolerans TaxID=368603 RepID=A0A1B8HQL1_9GAMM|nr:hypothetical protein AYY17_01870 [Morganella psychrotolerans]
MSCICLRGNNEFYRVVAVTGADSKVPALISNYPVNLNIRSWPRGKLHGFNDLLLVTGANFTVGHRLGFRPYRGDFNQFSMGIAEVPRLEFRFEEGDAFVEFAGFHWSPTD